MKRIWVSLVVLGLLATACTASGTPASAPPAKPATGRWASTVSVEFAGRDPVVLPLGEDAAQQVQLSTLDLWAADTPVRGEYVAGEGFQGFVVSPTGGEGSPHRILPAVVYVERDGAWYVLDKAGTHYYDLVHDDIRDRIAPDLLAERPATDPPAPAPAASMPAEVGDLGTWRLLEPDAVGPDSTELRLGVTRTGCSDGVTGTVLEPTVALESDRIIIRAGVEPLPPDRAHNCPGNDEVPVALTLPEPLGGRVLMDAACFGEALRFSYCTDGGVRYRP